MTVLCKCGNYCLKGWFSGCVSEDGLDHFWGVYGRVKQNMGLSKGQASSTLRPRKSSEIGVIGSLQARHAQRVYWEQERWGVEQPPWQLASVAAGTVKGALPTRIVVWKTTNVLGSEGVGGWGINVAGSVSCWLPFWRLEAWEPACRSSQRPASWIECGPMGRGWVWVTDGGPAQGAVWAGTQHFGSFEERDMAGLRWERPLVFSGPVVLQPCPLGGLRGILPTSHWRPWGCRGWAHGSFSIRVGQSFPQIAVFFLVQGTGKHIAMEWPSGSFCKDWLYVVGKGTLGLELS